MEDKLNKWDSYLSAKFLKAENVDSDNFAFECIGIVEALNKSKELRPRLTLKDKDDTYNFDLNKTNCKNLIKLNVPSPNALVGKKIYFRKEDTKNPTTQEDVEGLRIWKVE